MHDKRGPGGSCFATLKSCAIHKALNFLFHSLENVINSVYIIDKKLERENYTENAKCLGR